MLISKCSILQRSKIKAITFKDPIIETFLSKIMKQIVNAINEQDFDNMHKIPGRK